MELLILNGLLLLLDASIFLFQWPPLRIGLALLVLLFIPGYAWLSALYPRRSDLDALERVGLSIPLSIATVTLVGFVLALDATPWTLSLVSVLLSVNLLVALLSLVAFLRRYRLEPAERPLPLVWPARPVSLPFTRAQLAVVAFAAAVILGWVGYLAVPPPEARFTEFYTLDADGMAQNYPTQLMRDTPLPVNVGIVNREGEPQEYWVRAALGDQPVGNVGPVTLEPGRQWDGKVTVLVEASSAVSEEWQKLEFQLYKGRDAGEPYASAYLWVKVLPEEPARLLGE